MFINYLLENSVTLLNGESYPKANDRSLTCFFTSLPLIFIAQLLTMTLWITVFMNYHRERLLLLYLSECLLWLKRWFYAMPLLREVIRTGTFCLIFTSMRLTKRMWFLLFMHWAAVKIPGHFTGEMINLLWAFLLEKHNPYQKGETKKKQTYFCDYLEPWAFKMLWKFNFS